jgi:hypothetical protein
MGSSAALFMVLKKKTREAPSAVTSHVKVVAIKADHTGPMFEKKSWSDCMAQFEKQIYINEA